MKELLDNKVILVTGGTGSFGQHFIKTVLKIANPKKLIVFSRDEWKQSEMIARNTDKRLRFFLGDVRDLERLHRAFHGVDYVIHAAALKQVPTLEYNPFEAVKTNIVGAENIINAAIDQGVTKVVALSTDKAVNPANLYGATKLCAEKLFVNGNAYSGESGARFSVVRYGNVVGSRGSVIPFFLKERKTGVLPITDERMTRFWITLDQGVQLVLDALKNMRGGEIFIPKIPSMKITDLAKAVDPNCKIKYIGVRPGEKIHETLLTEEEASRTIDIGGCYAVEPYQYYDSGSNGQGVKGKRVPEGFRYVSDTNEEWVTIAQLQTIIKTLE